MFVVGQELTFELARGSVESGSSAIVIIQGDTYELVLDVVSSSLQISVYVLQGRIIYCGQHYPIQGQFDYDTMTGSIIISMPGSGDQLR